MAHERHMCRNVPRAKSPEVGTRGTRVYRPCAMCHRDGAQQNAQNSYEKSAISVAPVAEQAARVAHGAVCHLAKRHFPYRAGSIHATELRS
jgi:hypothetical protein